MQGGDNPVQKLFINRLLSNPILKYVFPYGLLIFIPASILLYYLKLNPVVIAVITLLSIIPLAGLIAKSTENLSSKSGTIVGSLLNVTLSNIFEIIIGVLAIRAGLIELVKASLIGSIIFNLLFVTGISMLAGGIKYHEQTFNRSSAGVASTMLIIAMAGLAMPTVYSALIKDNESVIIMSKAVAIALGVTYILSLVFVLFTHRHLFQIKLVANDQVGWNAKRSLVVLIPCLLLAIFESNILVNTVQPFIDKTGLSQMFIGLVIIGIIGNIPELLTAITFGIRNNITQSLEIGMNSAIQIALFAVPLLVFVGPLVGSATGLAFDLAFAPFEMVAVILAVIITNYLSSDGKCNWLEGVQLITVYVIIAAAMYFI